jgi:uncharacterized protein (UPF0332 family)
VKSETRAHLERAAEHVERAEATLSLVVARPLVSADAARNAYYAAFHAAKALIFERTGGHSKKHGSVHRAFADVTLTDACVDDKLRRFLPNAYEFKRVGDYETGLAAQIEAKDAETAVAEAKRFVSVVTSLLP